MNKKYFLPAFIIIMLAIFGYWYAAHAPSSQAPLPRTTTLTESEARTIAGRTCIKGGETLAEGTYNDSSRTWWFDANLNAAREGCNPACVVSEETGNAEINWRCTGLTPPVTGTGGAVTVTNFKECVAAGNPVVDGAPRQCTADGQVFMEEVLPGKEETFCTPGQRGAEVCAQIYSPVCATVEVQCIRAPCPPVDQTFSNACEACSNPLVRSYVAGECKE